jgi:hypothetical protein
MINILCDELLIEINKYLNNKDVINLLKTNSYLKKLFYNYGYYKYLVINSINRDIYNFAIQTAKHSKTLNCISINNYNNPQSWIFFWPKKVYLYYCNITDKIDPPVKCITERLEIINHNIIHKNNKKLFINWDKFPNLKIIYIKVNNLEMKNFEVIKNKNMYIELYDTKTIINTLF